MASADEGRRVAVSCDNCRARKVKCVRLQNDPCERCVKLGRGCSTGKVKSSRPYYQTSKEQFELMGMVVRHFLPNVSLEKDELREIVASISSQEQQPFPQNMPQLRPLDRQEKRQETHTARDKKRRTNGREDGRRRKRWSDLTQGVFEAPHDEEGDRREVRPEEEEEDGEDEENEEEEARHNENHNEERDGQESNDREEFEDHRDQPLSDVGGIGQPGTESQPDNCADQTLYQLPAERPGDSQSCQPVPLISTPSTGSPCSSISHDSLVVLDAMQIPRFHNGSSYSTFYSRIVANLALTHARLLRKQPPVSSHSVDGNTIEVTHPHNLPVRHQVEMAATRFFAEVNNVAYVLNYEQFQSSVEKIYTWGLPSTSASLAIVYLIVSFSRDSNQFYTEACQYSTAALAEGTLESVQALMLTSLCYLNRNHLNLAWVTVGSALRIAQSLGLHMHESSWKEESPFKIACKKRLWSSLYDLETTIACTLGRPPGVHEHSRRVPTSFNTEFDMNPYTPPGYTEASMSLGRLFNCVVHNVYLDSPASEYPDIAVGELLDNLQEWWNGLPAWLSSNCSMPPSHLRAVSHLNLRYYHIIIHLTRQYLLHSITNQASCTPDLIHRARICENANTQSILLLRELHSKKLISNINFFDALFILGNGAILFLRCLKNPSLELIAEVEKFLPMVSLMDHLTVGKFALRSMQGLLQDLQSFCDLQHEQSSSMENVEAPMVDFDLDRAMLGFWDNTLLWQQEKPLEIDSINNSLY